MDIDDNYNMETMMIIKIIISLTRMAKEIKLIVKWQTYMEKSDNRDNEDNDIDNGNILLSM